MVPISPNSQPPQDVLSIIVVLVDLPVIHTLMDVSSRHHSLIITVKIPELPFIGTKIPPKPSDPNQNVSIVLSLITVELIITGMVNVIVSNVMMLWIKLISISQVILFQSLVVLMVKCSLLLIVILVLSLVLKISTHSVM